MASSEQRTIEGVRRRPSRKWRMMRFALRYARLGWHVFPVHSVRHGRCTCGEAACERQGKHPLTPHGFKDATTDRSTIRQWWTIWPWANIAVATGKVSGIVVLDVDGGEGEASLRSLNIETPLLRSRSGKGWHHYYKYPGMSVESGVRVVPGVDVRADGGYIIVPPSRHVSGKRYRWT